MRLLLDEMLAPVIASQLRDRGHDVAAVSGDALYESMADAEVMRVARSMRRAVVTNNVRDFRLLHYAAVAPDGHGHYGIIFLHGSYRRNKADTGRIVEALEALLVATPNEDGLVNAEAWL